MAGAPPQQEVLSDGTTRIRYMVLVATREHYYLEEVSAGFGTGLRSRAEHGQAGEAGSCSDFAHDLKACCGVPRPDLVAEMELALAEDRPPWC